MDNALAAVFYEDARLLHQHLCDGAEVSWSEPSTKSDGSLVPAGPIYEPWLKKGVESATRLLNDHLHAKWMARYKQVGLTKTDRIPKADLDELASWFVMYGKRELMVVGILGKAVNAGTMLAMTSRLFELVPEPQANTTP